MATLVEAAKKKVKIGADAPAWRLTIGGSDISDRLISCEVTYSSSGESGMTLQVSQNLYHQSQGEGVRKPLHRLRLHTSPVLPR